MATGHFLIAGCGYLGTRVAAQWQQAGHRVTAVTRSTARAREFAERGWEPLLGDVTQPEHLPQLPPADVLLWAVGYDRARYSDIRAVYLTGLQDFLERLPVMPAKLIYISSTGVYGQDGGEWVDEESPTEPTREGGRVCLAAEDWLRASRWGPATLILRMAGIYGPGRLPSLEALRQGPVEVRADAYLNLIHVDDAARLVDQVAQRLAPPELLVVSDGQPVLRQDYLAYLAQVSGVDVPEFVDPVPGVTPTTRRTAGSKRVRTDRCQRLCPMTWQFPSYREGVVDAWSRRPA